MIRQAALAREQCEMEYQQLFAGREALSARVADTLRSASGATTGSPKVRLLFPTVFWSIKKFAACQDISCSLSSTQAFFPLQFPRVSIRIFLSPTGFRALPPKISEHLAAKRLLGSVNFTSDGEPVT